MNLYFTNDSRDLETEYETQRDSILKHLFVMVRSPPNAEFSHFMSLFYKGRQRNVPRI